MRRRATRGLALVATAAVVGGGAAIAATNGGAAPSRAIALTPIGSYDTGLADSSGDVTSGETAVLSRNRLYVTNSTGNTLDVVDASDPAHPRLLRRVDLPGGPNSVDAHGDLVAVAVEADPKTAPGSVVFLDRKGDIVGTVTVGALPDMLTFTRDGKHVLVANEGEPSGWLEGGEDPEGSVSIVSTKGIGKKHGPQVRTVDFRAFNAGRPRHKELPRGIRLNGPDPATTVAENVEPEYIAESADGRTAAVTLQEANAIARIDIRSARVTSIAALGWKDHSAAGNGLDPSDRDDGVHIATWPVRGLYMPDAIAAFRAKGRDYLITANEGDAREWPVSADPDADPFSDEVRVGSDDVVLDPAAFPDAEALKDDAALGRLNISATDGKDPVTGSYTALYSFGARSATIWTGDGRRVWDSGDLFERTVAAQAPAAFNVSNENNDLDDRSDNKGPEPEGVAVGEVGGRTYAFVGLERQGGVMVLDITNPRAPSFVQWANNRDYTADPAGPDTGPEVVHFIPKRDAPGRSPLVLVANEVSGTVTFYEVR